MADTPPKFYLTTPIYYVNARPHIGHAYTTIVADVVARRHRLLGDDTYFLTGTDEHGQKIERSAAAAGVPPQQFADEVAASFEGLWKRMGITYNKFIRTTDPAHKRGVQKLWRELEARGAIYLDSYTGAYCVSDEAFVDLPAGTPCPDCGRPLEIVTEENYFFRLSQYQDRLIELIESNRLVIQPETRRNEVLSFVRSGLKDLSISRSSFTWGVPVPEGAAAEAKGKHVVYVWLDALANYMTALGYGSDDPEDIARFERYWPADLHLVGKEIIRFHCVYWPAFLMAAELPGPKSVVAHGWLLFEESKMSKSRGNIVRTETILDAFGDQVYGKQFPESSKQERDLFAADVLRYFLLREIPFGQDGSFSFDALIQRYNSDLANGYGNLVSRTLNMIEKYFEGIVPTPSELERERLEGITVGVLSHDNNPLNTYDFSGRIEAIWGMLASTDQYITRQTPWKLAADIGKRQELANVLYNSAEFIRIYTALCYQYLPHATASVWAQLGLGSIEEAAARGELKNLEWGGLKPGTKLGPLAPIFPRADKGLAQIMADMESPVSPSTPEPASTDPHAGPRTASLAEENPGAKVAGSHALTTERTGTPPHSEAPASGIFAAGAQPAAGVQPATGDSGIITIDDFAKVDLRVAQIVVAERIPKADKLLRLEVDLGYERRQILAGIAEYYAPETLIGRKVVIVANLAPRKMRGLESNGMIVAASVGAEGRPVLAGFLEDVELGARLR